LASNFAVSEESWVLFHAPKLGHVTNYFTFPPKEGMLWIQPEKSDGFGRERTRDLGCAVNNRCICIIRLTQPKKLHYPVQGYMFRLQEVIVRPFLEHNT
jgi:hypothetical protein